jgi:hypothetical protein
MWRCAPRPASPASYTSLASYRSAARYLKHARRGASWIGARAPCTLGARPAARLVAALVLPALVGVPLGAALVTAGLWLMGIAALGFALPIALASLVATPLWAAAYVGTEASEAWTRVWNAALDQQHQHGT